jgi:hypothetical protein
MSRTLLAIESEDATAANRALELLGRELGMFVERRQDVKDELDALPADQRRALIEAMKAALEARQARALDGVVAGVAQERSAQSEARSMA